MNRQKALTGLQEWLFRHMQWLLETKLWRLRVALIRHESGDWGMLGLADLNRRRITISPLAFARRTEPIRCLVHEFGHAIFLASEDEILAFEEWFYRAMTPRQKKVLQRYIQKAVVQYKARKRSRG